jgi:hypothetical protein
VLSDPINENGSPLVTDSKFFAQITPNCNPITPIQDGTVTKSFNVYPNPAYGMLHIRNAPASSDITLFDLHGKELLVQKTTKGEVELDIRSLPKGLYLLRVGDITGRLDIE